MPKAIEFRVNGRLAISDDLFELQTKTAALSNVIAQLRTLGVIGEFKTRIINTRTPKSDSPELELSLGNTGLDRLAFVKMRGMQCAAKHLLKNGEEIECYKPAGHDDWHEADEGNGLAVTWPADRPAAEPHPDSGGEPLPDKGPGPFEAMGLKPSFEYGELPMVPRRKDKDDG